MSSITELTPEVISLLNENEAAVLAYVSRRHYEQVVEQNRDHLLVRVGQRFDCSAVEKACAKFHAYAGERGQPATHTIGQLCRAQVVKALYHWSDRQTAAEIATNDLLRWFVGYQLGEATLSYSTLWRFGEWLKKHQPRLLFNEILKQIDADFPAEASAPQVGDTFALHSRAREQSRIELLRTACTAVLTQLATVSTAGHQAVVQVLDKTQLFGADDEKPEHWLEKADRDARERRTALGAHHCLTLVEEQLKPLGQGKTVELAALQHRTALLAKILTDYFVFTTVAAPEGHPMTTAAVRTESVKGSYRLGSTVDEEATFRQHRNQADFGYNINVAATTNFVREINAVTGATPDSVGVAPLIAHQQEHLGVVPPKLIYDRAAGMPKIFADVDKASDGKTQLVARLIDHSKNKERFGPSAFTLDEQGHLHCPNGQATNRAYPSGSADGFNYRFTAHQCQGCPFWDKCRDPKSKPNSHRNAGTERSRSVFVSAYAYQQRQALAYTKTDAFQHDMKLRPHIERTIACLTRYNGARHATGFGRKNADFQVRMSALAFNLKRWLVLTIHKEQPAPRPWPDSP